MELAPGVRQPLLLFSEDWENWVISWHHAQDPSVFLLQTCQRWVTLTSGCPAGSSASWSQDDQTKFMGKSSSRKRQVFPSFLQVRNRGRGPSNSEQMKVTCENRDPASTPTPAVSFPTQREGVFQPFTFFHPQAYLSWAFGEAAGRIKRVRGAGRLPAPTIKRQEAPALGIDLWLCCVHFGWWW